MSQDDVRVERDVLGCILRQPEVVSDVIEVLPNAEYFTDYTARQVYETILKQEANNERFDISILQELGCLGTFMVDCIEGAAFLSNPEEYAKIIQEKGRKRLWRHELRRLDSDIDNPEKSLDELVSDAEEAFGRIEQNGTKEGPRTTKSLTPGMIETINNYALGIQPEGRLRTGVKKVDEIVRIMPGNLIYIGGWVSQGKTQLALQIAQWNAVKHGVKSRIFSLEMTAEELMERLMLAEANIDSQTMIDGKLDSDEMDRVVRAQARLDAAPLDICDNIYGISEIKSAAKRAVRRDGVKLIVIDYVQLVAPLSGENRRVEVSGMSRDFKRLAMELRIPIIVLTQLTALPSGVAKRRPVLNDVAEAKSIAADANSLLLVYKIPELDPEKMHYKAEIIIEKQRNGPRGRAPMRFVRGRWEERSWR